MMAENENKLSRKQLCAGMIAFGLLLLLSGIRENQVIDATIRSYSGITTGIVTTVQKEKCYSRGVGEWYLYHGNVIYTVNHVKYQCKIFDDNENGAEPYFSVGDSVTVNYIPDEPKLGISGAVKERNFADEA